MVDSGPIMVMVRVESQSEVYYYHLTLEQHTGEATIKVRDRKKSRKMSRDEFAEHLELKKETAMRFQRNVAERW